MKINGVKTIDVSAKEWYDKVNGNSYFSGRVTINYGMPDEKTLLMPFQYGYGSQYESEAWAMVRGALDIDDDRAMVLWRFCDAHKIVLRASKQTRCLKREVVSYGNN